MLQKRSQERYWEFRDIDATLLRKRKEKMWKGEWRLLKTKPNQKPNPKYRLARASSYLLLSTNFRGLKVGLAFHPHQ